MKSSSLTTEHVVHHTDGDHLVWEVCWRRTPSRLREELLYDSYHNDTCIPRMDMSIKQYRLASYVIVLRQGSILNHPTYTVLPRLSRSLMDPFSRHNTESEKTWTLAFQMLDSFDVSSNKQFCSTSVSKSY